MDYEGARQTHGDLLDFSGIQISSDGGMVLSVNYGSSEMTQILGMF